MLPLLKKKSSLYYFIIPYIKKNAFYILPQKVGIKIRGICPGLRL
jgi:hypothetical protein